MVYIGAQSKLMPSKNHISQALEKSERGGASDPTYSSGLLAPAQYIQSKNPQSKVELTLAPNIPTIQYKTVRSNAVLKDQQPLEQ